MNPSSASPSVPAHQTGARPGLAPLCLGGIRVDPPLFLAPMAGFTNLAFRRVVKRLGCAFTTTEMVMARGVVDDHARTLAIATLDEAERPAGVQIAGGEPEILAEAARRLVARGADLIDLNMGCPVRKIVERSAGAALLRDPDRARRAVEAVRRAVPVPVTVKIRAGWDDASQSVEAARAVEAGGAAAIAVHGRTREQQYAGRSDLLAIRAVKEAVAIPVIGNGDVVRPGDATRMVEATGVDGIMIGRAALRDPWIFAAVARELSGEGPAPLPSADERREVLLELFDEMVALRGERTAVLQMRRFAATYLRAFPGARRLRERLPHLSSRADFVAVADEVFSEGSPPALVPDHERPPRRARASGAPPPQAAAVSRDPERFPPGRDG